MTNPGRAGDYHLSNQIRQETHEPCALDGVRQLALVPLAHAGTLARDDLSETGEVAAERVRILVVNCRRMHAAEMTGSFFLLLLCHNWGSRGPD